MCWLYESFCCGVSIQWDFGDFDMAWGGWEIEGEFYIQVEGIDFCWFCFWMLGGCINYWGCIFLCFGFDDFCCRDIDGLGVNWLIFYEDIKFYYDKVDKLIGVFGINEGLFNDFDGFFLFLFKLCLYEWYYIKGVWKFGVIVIFFCMLMFIKCINKECGLCFYCG